MTRKEYIDTLASELEGFDDESKRDILLEIEDHIDELAAKHPELSEEEIVVGLEKPIALAESLKAEAGISRGKIGERQEARSKGGFEGENERAHGRENFSGKARITIDGEDLEDVVRRALDVARLFKESKIFREERSAGEDGEKKAGKSVRLQDIPVDKVKKIVFSGRSTDVKVLLSVEGFSMQADGPEKTKFSIDDDEQGVLEIRTGSRHDEPDQIELKVPSSVEELSIRTLSGDVMVLDRIGDLEIHTASGDVTVRACSGNLSVRTASGDIAVEHCSEDLRVDTASGSVNVELDDQCCSASVTTASGDISCGYPEDFDALIKCSTVSGEVTRDGEEAEAGTIRVGAGLSPVNLSTASGDIQVNRL